MEVRSGSNVVNISWDSFLWETGQISNRGGQTTEIREFYRSNTVTSEGVFHIHTHTHTHTHTPHTHTTHTHTSHTHTHTHTHTQARSRWDSSEWVISSSQRAYVHIYPSFIYFWKIFPRCFLLSAVPLVFSSPIERLFTSDTNTVSVFISSLHAVRDWKPLNSPFQHPSTPSCPMPCVLIIPRLSRSYVFTRLYRAHNFPCLPI